MSSSSYTGRFAPSPTGPLHLGSLFSATLSYLRARQQQGRWLLRIEDLDPPREIKGASEDIQRCLDAFGFEWDGATSYQSQRLEHYQHKLHWLVEQGHAYACNCSRKQLLKQTPIGVNGYIYPGFCREKTISLQQRHAWRLRCPDEPSRFDDLLQGSVEHNLFRETGDFIIKRSDGLFAYQLAVVVDDIEQGITEVVRGVDLLFSTPAQRYLYHLFKHPAPAFMHSAVIVQADGNKLSKQTGAAAVDYQGDIRPILLQILSWLQLPIHAELQACTPGEIWDWAIKNWQWQKLRHIQHISQSSAGITL